MERGEREKKNKKKTTSKREKRTDVRFVNMRGKDVRGNKIKIVHIQR